MGNIDQRSGRAKLRSFPHHIRTARMSPDEVVQKALEVIGEAVSLEPDDLQDHETWKFLGLGENLQNATASDLSSALDFAVAPKDFQTYLDVGSFKSFLQQKASRGNGT